MLSRLVFSVALELSILLNISFFSSSSQDFSMAGELKCGGKSDIIKSEWRVCWCNLITVRLEPRLIRTKNQNIVGTYFDIKLSMFGLAPSTTEEGPKAPRRAPSPPQELLVNYMTHNVVQYISICSILSHI